MAYEREMTVHQRGLVDTCFEEGHYQPAIALLDQLRSPSFAPPPDHVRQLLYIALFPPPDQPDEREHAPPSPVKGSPSKHKPPLSKASLSPLPADSAAAQRVLFSFLATNSPVSLLRALPRYPLDDAPESELPPEPNGGQDSPVARESLCIKDCRHCWAILKDGFIQRKRLLPRDARKRRGRSAYDVDQDQDQGHATPAVVAEHAWPILHWLLSLFEKDELLNFQRSGEKFSPLLLSQIPPPRGGTGPRWAADAPLDIVLHAADQNDGERRDMATRLLALLINLSYSGSFDGPMLAATLTTRLYTSSAQITQHMMESLPKTISILTFKINVCQNFLSSPPSVDGGTKPRPRPLPKRGTRRESETMTSIADPDVGRVEPSSLSSPPAVVECPEVLQLVCSKHKSLKLVSEPPILTIKYSLLVSYALLQGLLPLEERDDDWKDAQSDGRLAYVVDTAFPSDSVYHKALAIITRYWPAV